MAKRLVEGIEVETGSGNVFADLGLPDAEKLKIKSGLVIEIARAVRQLGLTQEKAGRRMGIPQPKVSALLRGNFANLSEHKLMDCLNFLDSLNDDLAQERITHESCDLFPRAQCPQVRSG